MTLKHLLPALLLLTLMLTVSRQAFAQQTEEQLGVQYYQNKEFDKSLATFESLFEKSPNLFNYIYYINSIIELKDFDRAEKVIKKQAKQNPGDPRYKIDMGFVTIMRGDVQKGKKMYEESIKDLTADKSQVYNLANAFLNRRETDYAARTYMKGRDIFKDPSLFSLELSYLYESLGNYEQMLNEYLNLLTAQPNQLTMVENRLQAWLSLDTENERNEALRTLLLKKTQQNPDEILYAELLLWYSVQQKDFSLALIQAKALDRRYGENGSRIFDLASLAISNNDYDVAIDAYTYIIRKNTDPDIVLASRIALLDTEFEKATTSYVKDRVKIGELEKKYQSLLSELGVSAASVPLMRNLAHMMAFYLDRQEDAVDLLEKAIDVPGLKPQVQAECKLELADIFLFSGEEWEATLLYSQVEKAFKNEPMGHEAKFRNARLSFYIGEFGWARAQLDILKAATSKLIANDAMELSLLISDNIEDDSSTAALSAYARADLLVFRNKYDEALQVLDSVEKQFPGHSIIDDVIYKKAEISVNEGQYDKAAGYFSEIVKDYHFSLLGDDAMFHLADLYENQLNKKDKAQELYQNLMIDYPGSLWVVEARKRFRALRNDPVN